MKYAYLRSGGPILDWSSGPPTQSRAADTVALGTLASPTLELPAPGAPEPIGDYIALGGCSCSGSCGCGSAAPAAVGDFIDAIPGGYLTLGVAAFFAWRMMQKRKKR